MLFPQSKLAGEVATLCERLRSGCNIDFSDVPERPVGEYLRLLVQPGLDDDRALAGSPFCASIRRIEGGENFEGTLAPVHSCASLRKMEIPFEFLSPK